MNGSHIVSKTLNHQLMISLLSNEMSADDVIYLSVNALRQSCLAKGDFWKPNATKFYIDFLISSTSKPSLF